MKACSKCKVLKEFSDFAICRREKSGYRSACKECMAVYHAENAKAINSRKAAYRANNAEKVKALSDKWFEKNEEKQRKAWANYRVENKKNRNEYQVAYRAANKEKVLASKVKRYADIRQATPSWADKAVFEEFKTIALMFRMYTGQNYHVDHVVPLRGKVRKIHIVCGLHCEANLTVLPEIENWGKSNQKWPDMP